MQFKKALGPMHVLGMHNLSQDGVIMNIFFCSLKAVIKADSDCQNEHFKSMPAKEEVLRSLRLDLMHVLTFCLGSLAPLC